MAWQIIGEGDPMHVVEFTYEPGKDGPDPHIHHEHADSFYVLEGELELMLGTEPERVALPAGGFALVPPGVVHTFRNPGPSEARFLNFHAPGKGFAPYMRGERDSFDSDDPPQDGGRPVSDAIVAGPGDGDAIALGPSRALIKASDPEHLSLSETTVAPGFPGPVLHRHETFVDSFYVLEGTLMLSHGDDSLELTAGEYAYVPPGTAHTFSNPGGDPVRFLNVMAPGGFEQYLKEVAALPGPPDPQAMAQIASRYDFHAVA